jgi:(+)-trans-carveol dehydrogenase
MGRVEGKVAFITGAARGQGRSHALMLSKEGAAIIAVDICGQIDTVPYQMGTKSDLDDTVRLVKAAGGTIFAERADVRDYEQMCEVLGRGVAHFGGLDIVCANAGITSMAPLASMDNAMWSDMIEVNLAGAWKTCKSSVPYLIERGGGSIIMTSSVAGLHGEANVGNYVAAKHGLIGLMRSFAKELMPYMIRVNTVNPTTVDTPMVHNSATYSLFRPDLAAPTRDDVRGAFVDLNGFPVPWIDPSDVSNAIIYLASDESRYVTGSVLLIDAGQLQK